MSKNKDQIIDEIMDTFDGKRVAKFCIDCRYFKKGFFEKINDAKCTHSSAKTVEKPAYFLVRGGKDKISYQTCNSQRMSHNPCGTDAKLFERKQ